MSESLMLIIPLPSSVVLWLAKQTLAAFPQCGPARVAFDSVTTLREKQALQPSARWTYKLPWDLLASDRWIITPLRMTAFWWIRIKPDSAGLY